MEEQCISANSAKRIKVIDLMLKLILSICFIHTSLPIQWNLLQVMYLVNFKISAHPPFSAYEKVFFQCRSMTAVINSFEVFELLKWPFAWKLFRVRYLCYVLLSKD